MKNITPMQIIKKELNELKSLSGFNCFTLNGKKSSVKFVSGEMYSSAPITFDFLIILGFGDIYRNDKGDTRYEKSLSVGFNYKDTETKVRAGVAYKGDVDYSKSYTLSDFKDKLKTFLLKGDVDSFVSIFEIVKSSTVTKAEANKIKNKYVAIVASLKAEIKLFDSKAGEKRRVIYDKKSQIPKEKFIEELRSILNKRDSVQLELNSLLFEGSKDMPCIVRKMFFNEISKKHLV